MANHDGVAQEFAEPFGRGNGGSRECQCCTRDVPAVIWNGEGDTCEAGIVRGAYEMQRGGAGGVDQAAIEGIDGPGAVELEAASGTYGGCADFYGVEGFDGMDLDADQAGNWWRLHLIILTEW